VPRLLPIALTGGAILWLSAIVLAPFALRDPRTALASAFVYAGASHVCHQKPERSFHLSGVTMPVCARCTGLYVAGVLGACLAWAGAASAPRRMRAVMLTSAAPMAVTVVLEWVGLWQPANLTRAIVSVPPGVAAGWIVVRMLRAEARAASAGQTTGL
jgi:uncharacterized membrane protein